VSPVADGGVVAFEAVGECAQVGQVLGADGGDPGVQAFAGPAGHHLCECLPMTVQGVQVGAGRQHAGELELLVSARLSGRRRIQLVTCRTLGWDVGRRGHPAQGCQAGVDGGVAAAEA
jgi:hypothetical protein